MFYVHGPITKDFITVVNGHQWRRLRHSTTPLMTQSKLSNMLKMINLAAKTMVEGETHLGEVLGSRLENRTLLADNRTVSKNSIFEILADFWYRLG